MIHMPRLIAYSYLILLIGGGGAVIDYIKEI